MACCGVQTLDATSSAPSNHANPALPMTPITDLPSADPADLGLCPHRTRRLVSVLQAEVDRGYLPGAVVLLARHGRIALHEAVGTLDPAHSQPMTRDAIFRIYSMTKPVVSVAVMMLVEQGRLLLTDPVAKHLPEFAGQQVATERNGVIELRPVHAACHRAGPAAPHRRAHLRVPGQRPRAATVCPGQHRFTGAQQRRVLPGFGRIAAASTSPVPAGPTAAPPMCWAG